MRRTRKPMAQMNVVPYIDVMLVLLVIFMVTAPMLKAGVEIDAPDANASPLTTNNQQEPLIISVSRDGKYYLDSQTDVSLSEVSDFVRTQMTQTHDRPVYVKADGGVEYQYLMQAMVAVQQAGAKKIGLMADPLGKP